RPRRPPPPPPRRPAPRRGQRRHRPRRPPHRPRRHRPLDRDRGRTRRRRRPRLPRPRRPAPARRGPDPLRLLLQTGPRPDHHGPRPHRTPLTRRRGPRTRPVPGRRPEAETQDPARRRARHRRPPRPRSPAAAAPAPAPSPAAAPKKKRRTRPVGEPVTAGDHVLAYVRAQRDALVELDPAVRQDVPDAVHRMRVATRRLRSTFRSFRSVLHRDTTDPIGADLKWLAGELGLERDQEVLAERLTTALDRLPDDLVRGPVRDRLAAWSGARRSSAHGHVTGVLDSARHLALLDSLDA